MPSQDPRIAEHYPEIPVDWYQKSVVLVGTDGRTWRGAEAVVRTLAVAGGSAAIWLWLYKWLPGFAAICEFVYSIVARFRTRAAGLTRFIWFGRVQLPSLSLTRWLFLRSIGLVYLVAFASLLVQIKGLVGERGILPAREYFASAAEQLGSAGFWQLPSLYWFFTPSDSALLATCLLGAAASLFIVAGIAQLPMLVVVWALYLSLCGAGQTFLNFQWETLLLETGFLACLVAPLTFRPRRPMNEGEPSRLAVWLLRWLAFRLMFQSGAVKLLSGDTTWRDLTALSYHFETQPLPTVLGWIVHQAPLWWQKFSTLGMYGTEIGLAFFIFFPRGLRIIAAWSFIFLQIGIMLTGNYGFFNLLCIAICLSLLDDFIWPRRWGGKRLRGSNELCAENLGTGACGIRRPQPLENSGAEESTGRVAVIMSRRRALPRVILIPVAALILLISMSQLLRFIMPGSDVPGPLVALVRTAAPFRSINAYGLFAVMTTTRPEITVEGSDDGQTWKAYVFRHKPGPLDRLPGFIQPYMPRLDWQMWFASLGSLRSNPWFVAFVQRLLEGEPSVLGLLQENPFPDSPPPFIRARIQDYRFTTFEDKWSTSNWWKMAGEERLYCPTLTLVDGQVALMRAR